MNIPQIYLVEPYNAYAPKRKKHWMEEVEEQALLAKIVAEQQAIQEAQANRSTTLPPQAPPVSQQTAQTYTGGAGAAGGANTGGGAGGLPPYGAFHPGDDTINFNRIPAVGDAPLTVTFINYTTNPTLYTYLWDFGDGTTSTDVNPVHVYQSQSTATGVWTASVTATSKLTNAVVGTSPNVYTSASIPSVAASFTFTTSSNIAPFSASFVNTSTNSSQTPSTIYRWVFSDGTTSTSANVSRRVDSGSFTASLQVTGSYGIARLYTQSFYATPPTLTAAFTTTSFGFGGVANSYMEPTTMSFTNNTAYNGAGTLTYRWEFGSSSFYSAGTGAQSGVATTVGPHTRADYIAGGYTASLQVTESIYGIKSKGSRTFTVST